tara:strand:- start:665 stop:907 length:243 start_codon:yes stop_codon:yes gene_type:complete
MAKAKTFNVASPQSANRFKEMKVADYSTVSSLFAELNLSPSEYSTSVQNKDGEVIDNVDGGYTIREGEFIIISRSSHKSG